MWFACDTCYMRFWRQGPLPQCVDCWNEVCQQCMDPGSDWNDEGLAKCLCRNCAAMVEDDPPIDAEEPDEIWEPDSEVLDVDFG